MGVNMTRLQLRQLAIECHGVGSETESSTLYGTMPAYMVAAAKIKLDPEDAYAGLKWVGTFKGGVFTYDPKAAARYLR